MAVGNFNPKDNTNATSVRPSATLAGAGVRRWFQVGTRFASQDINGVIAQFRTALDYFGLTDTEGDDNLLRDLLLNTATRRNWAGNPSFDIWQENTTYTPASATTVHVADLWKIRRAAAEYTVSRQTGFSGATYCIRIQKNAASILGNNIRFAHQLDSDMVRQLAGQTVKLSFDVRCGANYSWGTGFDCMIQTGTAGGEVADLSNANAPFATGSVNSGDLLGAFTPTTTAERKVATSYTVPSTAADMIIRFLFTPTAAAAGAADYVEITNVKLEVGGSATAFRQEPFPVVMAACQRRYRKSFNQAIVPSTLVGLNTGEFVFAAPRAGALLEISSSVMFGSPMRSTSPTVTLYNPSSANAEVRDHTAPADCSASSAANISDSGFRIICTGNASTLVGNILGVHWTADARL